MNRRNQTDVLDYSTIDLNKLMQFDVFNNTGNEGRFLGHDCFLNPPGHPSYFVERALKSDRHHRGAGPRYVLKHPDDNYYRVILRGIDPSGLFAKITDDLYLPLPYTHPRVQAWIKRVYEYHRNAYMDSERKDSLGVKHVATYYIDKSNKSDPKMHMAYIKIHSMYAEHEPDLHLIAHPRQNKDTEIPEFWWETHRTIEDALKGEKLDKD